MGGLIGEGRHLGARNGSGERRPKLSCDRALIGSGPEREDGVVHGP